MESMLIVILLLISIVSFGFYTENKIIGNAVNEKGG